MKNIQVVRLDATVHSNVANYFDIGGYPTVKFIRGAQIISYENARTKSAVLNFLKRVNGPAIRWIDSIDQYEQIRREHDVFFLLLLLLPSIDDHDRLIKEYSESVHRHLSQAYFYATNSSIVHQQYLSKYSSGVLAIKTDGIFPMQSSNSTLDEFILQEKVITFPQVAAGNMYDLILTKKILIIYGFNEKQSASLELKSSIYNYVLEHSSTLHNRFQFAWTNDLELLNNIGESIFHFLISLFLLLVAVWTLQAPLFFLYDSNERKYGIYPLLTSINENIPINSILDQIVSNYREILQHMGNTWQKRLLRPFWELYRTFMAMFVEAPGLSMLIIGLPSAILSILCYCLCCLPNESLLDENEFLEQKSTIEKKDE